MEGKDKTFEGLRPLETPEQRPDLWIGECTKSIWLRKGSGCICVKPITTWYMEWGEIRSLQAGSRSDNLIGAVRYTGPIDDETMANILIFGG